MGGGSRDNHEETLDRLRTVHGFCCLMANTFPVNPNDLSSTHVTAHLWVHVVASYSGLEQTLKRVLRVRGLEPKGNGGPHELNRLWEAVPEECRVWARACYSEWISAVREDGAGNEGAATADGFIAMIGKGYNHWRYWPNEPENDAKIPQNHEWLILEVWAGILDWLAMEVEGEKAIQRGPLLRSLDSVGWEVWEDLVQEGRIDSKLDMCGDQPNGRCVAEAAAAALWCAANDQAVSAIRLPAAYDIAYRQWAEGLEGYIAEEVGMRSPYDAMHRETIKTWAARCRKTLLRFDRKERRWVVSTNDPSGGKAGEGG